MSDVPATADRVNHPEETVTAAGRYRPLRIWPAIVLLGVMLVARNLPGWWENGPSMIWASAAFGPALCGILLLLWWGVGSRANWREKVVGVAWVLVALVAAIMLMDKSMHGPGVMVLTIPIGMAAFALSAIVLSGQLSFQRTIIACLMATIGFGATCLVKTTGMWGNFAVDLNWRFAPTAEDQIAARDLSTTTISLNEVASDALDEHLTSPEWSGFRGPNRDGVQHGTILAENLSATDVKELWRIPIGSGWSSFAVAGNLLFTQEQRGEMETVVCYAADSGKEVWAQAVKSRFDDPLGGPGPRSTPTLAGGALYAMGATGELMKLDPKTGEEMWRVNIKEVSGAAVPMWGFSSSPLVTGDIVIVYAGAKDGKGTLGFAADTGELKWSAPAGEHSYSSPQLVTLLGEELVVLTTNLGVDFLSASSGEVRFHYDWSHDGYRANQPVVLGEDAMLIPTGMGSGTRRVKLTKSDDGKITAEELWTTVNLKPDFNDALVYDGHVYGFDNTIFTCLNLETGERAWKGGRYGKGQQLLLADSKLLLVITEEGELKLVQPTPEKLAEVLSMKALTGRTWNHPVVVGNRVYLRNAQEAVCLEVPIVPPTADVALAIP